ncbi:aminomethyl transferase family protein [Streptomyces olivaceus]|uniref:aminomethyl transferase family protein n=1 Tax=Streptomyces olivaceus TaxID=47716 RepID=UPI00381710EE
MNSGNAHPVTYEAALYLRQTPTVGDPPVLFAPAAAAQDEGNVLQSYGRFAQMLLPMEYTGWMDECVAHVQSCYIGDWSSLHKLQIRGRQALEFLGWLGMRDVITRFDIGQVKHHVQLDEGGWVASEGIVCRLGVEEFLYTAGSGDWLLWQLESGRWDAEVTDVTADRFIFGIQGPESPHVVEALVGESVRDIAFSRSRMARIDGVEVRVLRTGISGEVGYEIHGPSEAANTIWTAAVRAGQPFGIRQLGIRSQPVQHIEAGIATNGLDYLPASILTPGAPRQFRRGTPGGSYVSSNGITDYFRRPGELGWGFRKGIPARDFLGRDALVADAAQLRTQRTLVGLHWNRDDVMSLFGAVLAGDEDLPQAMELPRARTPAFDQVLVRGELAGISTGRTLSLNLGATISLCVIDSAHCAPGTEVIVVWGEPGTVQREMRATVTTLPFKPDRRRNDVTAR